jgi:hypothetical protein
MGCNFQLATVVPQCYLII